MKKFLACLLALALLLSSLATMVSCDGGSGSEDAVGTDEKKSEQTTEMKTDEPTQTAEPATEDITTTAETTEPQTTLPEETTSPEETTEEVVTDPPHVCQFSKWVPSDQYLASPATCTEPSYYYYSCYCGKHDENTFSWGSANGHKDYVSLPAVEANCTETGLTEGWKCGVCGEITTSQVETPTNSKHNYENGACIRCGLAQPSSGLEFEYRYGSYYVVGIGTCTDPEIVIPPEYDGTPVTGIADMAFAHNKNIVKITLPATLQTIGDRAFTECENLVEIYNLSSLSINVGDNWSSNGCVAQYAKNVYTKDYGSSILVYQDDFIFCKYGEEYRLIAYKGDLTDISLPESVEYSNIKFSEYAIGTWAFAWNKEIKSVSIPESVTAIYGSAFYYCENLEKVMIGKSVGRIDSFAFAYSGLKTVDIPANVRTIGDNAFLQIRNLESVTLGNGIENIGDYVFSTCSSLKSIHIPASVNYLGVSVLHACNSLVTFIVDENCTATVYSNVFADCTALQTVELNNATTEIGNEMFKYCTSLESVKLGNSVTYIGDSAFYGCSALTSIEIPTTVTKIGNSAFTGCSSLESVTIGENVETIGAEAFRNCVALQSIVIPDNVTELGAYAFTGCTALKTVSVGANVNAINNNTFENCFSLETVDLGYNVTSIGEYAFYGCASLEEITIPGYVRSIGQSVFSGCSSLRSLTVPFIGESANSEYKYPLGYFFGSYEYEGSEKTSQRVYYSEDYYNAAEYYIPITLETVSVTSPYVTAGAFENCKNIKHVTLPEGLNSIGERTFYFASSLESVNIPSTVTSVGDYAFAYCNALVRVDVVSIASFLNVTFDIYYSNPLSCSSYNEGCALYIDGEKITNVEIPDTVTEIKDSAFAGCSTIESITIPASVQSIGQNAFKDCTKLKSVRIVNLDAWFTVSFANEFASPFSGGAILYVGDSEVQSPTLYIPAGVSSVPDYAFAYSDIDAVSIPSSVTSIGASAFKGSTGIALIYVDSFESWLGISFEDEYSNPMHNGSELFIGLELMTEAIFPVGTTTVRANAFSNCTGLTKVVIPAGVQSIEAGAFANCINLKHLVIPDGVAVDYKAFEGCENIEYLEAPASVLYCIDKSALKEVVITSGTSIDYQAFYACRTLGKVTLPESLTYIGKQAFAGTAITRIVIPDNVTQIAEDAFEDCYRLAHVTLGQNVQEIGHGAFAGTMTLVEIYNRSSLEIVACESNSPNVSANGYIGEGVKRIYTEGESNVVDYEGFVFFYDAENDVYYLLNDDSPREESVLPDSINGHSYQIADRAFYYRYDLKKLTLSEGVTKIGASAFYHCENLEYMNTPDSLVYIGMNAFTSCNKLFEIVDGIYYIDKWVAGYGYDKTITSAVVREGTVGLAFNAFYHYNGNNIRSFTLPSTLKYICQDAFYGCSPDSLYITDLAAWCNAWRDDGYTNIMAYSRSLGNLYVNGELVTDLVIPEGVTEIGKNAFLHFNITTLKLPSTLQTIGMQAFHRCSALQSIEFNSNIKTIGYAAFDGCSNLTTLTLPEGLEKISGHAFRDCSKLTTINIPSTVNYIGTWAFLGSGVTTFNYNGTPTQWQQIDKEESWSPSRNYTVNYASN